MSDEKVPAAPAPAAMPAIGGGQNALLEFSDDEKTALEGMSGMDKAVLLMLSLSEEDAAQIFKNLEPKQVQKLGIRMSEMATFSQDQVNAVHKAFLKEVTKHSNLGLGNSDFVRHALVSALGSEKANNLIEQISLGTLFRTSILRFRLLCFPTLSQNSLQKFYLSLMKL